jgi:hypothetical protein
MSQNVSSSSSKQQKIKDQILIHLMAIGQLQKELESLTVEPEKQKVEKVEEKSKDDNENEKPKEQISLQSASELKEEEDKSIEMKLLNKLLPRFTLFQSFVEVYFFCQYTFFEYGDGGVYMNCTSPCKDEGIYDILDMKFCHVYDKNEKENGKEEEIEIKWQTRKGNYENWTQTTMGTTSFDHLLGVMSILSRLTKTQKAAFITNAAKIGKKELIEKLLENLSERKFKGSVCTRGGFPTAWNWFSISSS